VAITADELTEVLATAADGHHVPGAAAGVLLDDQAITAAHGITNAQFPSPVSTATLFQVGSVSKTITSAAVMLLVQDGSVSLDDPVARHLPDLGPATGLDTDAITVEMILSHQSGFDGDHLFVVGSTDLDDLAGARRLFEPGHGFSYSNAGFSIAGAVVEAASGQGYEAFVRDRLFRPLGMRSACCSADDAITFPVAAPHWVFEGTAHVLRRAGWQPGWELLPADRPPAGVIASLEDLLVWCRFQWTGVDADGTEVLSAESLERLHTPVVRADRDEEIGLDWSVERIDGATAIGHGGVTVGYVTDLLVVPDEGFAFVGLTNATNGAAVNQAVRRWALEHGPGLIERDPEPDPALAPTLDLTPHAGRYLHSFAALEITPGVAPGTVVLTSSRRDDVGGWQPPIDDPITYAFVAPDHAVSLDAPGPVRTITFGLDATGGRPAEWVQVNGRRAPRAD
jgi:CubicO group peptidase (beta-lactamase class C family)